MGQSTDGILAFGWDLGSVEDRDEDHWAFDLLERIDDADDLDDIYVAASGVELPPDPWDELRDRPNEWFYEPLRPREFTPRETIEFRGWKQNTHDAQQARYAARREAIDSIDFELVGHCSCDYRMYLLTLKDLHWSANRGRPVEVSQLLGWTPGPVPVRQLLRAAELLGVDPPEPPKLLLASDWC